MRKEKDFLGEIDIPNEALYGIHSLRAKNNFLNSTKFNINWYKSIAIVKLAMYYTYQRFKQSALSKYQQKQLNFNFISDEIIVAMICAAKECSDGLHYQDFIVPALTGGAGTSQNMNMNEIIANRALEILSRSHGEYDMIHPIDHCNIYQSTNDVIPTALKTAIMLKLSELENSINILRKEIEILESSYRSSLRIAYTQMQEAVPSTFGRLFSAYNEALSRDWWRVSKCFERIKVVNLGGSAVGTGITVPRFFLFEAVSELRKITELPMTRAENLADATQNLDSFVEIHAIIKSNAVNLEKIATDIRLLASDIRGIDEINIPKMQAGSSIMPAKVNPVISEYIVTIAHKIYANDIIISSMSGQGCLDLNPYLPIIGDALLESLDLLISANLSMTNNLFKGLEIDVKKAEERLFRSPAIATALLPLIGYDKAGIIAKLMKEKQFDVFEANNELNFIENNKLKEILQSENLLKEGFSISQCLI